MAKLKFGDKVKFDCEVHENLKDVEFCLLGMCDSAVALVEWRDRGKYYFRFVGCNPETDLIKIK